MSERLTAAVGTVWIEASVRFQKASCDKDEERAKALTVLLDRLETEFPQEVMETVKACLSSGLVSGAPETGNHTKH